MLDFGSLAASFNRQSPLTIYCAVRRPSNDLEAMVYPAWLIQAYGDPFEESLSESDDGCIEQVLLFSDCGSNREVLDDWRGFSNQAGLELIRVGLPNNPRLGHSPTIEWLLGCLRILEGLKTDFLDQDRFDQSKGLVTTLGNAWGMSSLVCLKLAKGEVPKVEAAGHDDIGNPCEPKDSKEPKRLNTNVRMIDYMQKHKEAYSFTVRQWMYVLDIKSTSTIHATETWKSLKSVKQQAGRERLERQSNKIDENPNGKKNPKRDKPL